MKSGGMKSRGVMNSERGYENGLGDRVRGYGNEVGI